jgi:tetratricopeptide (TPR) repeat protein
MNYTQTFGLVHGLLMQGDLAMQSGDVDVAKHAYQRAKDSARNSSSTDEAGFAIACDKLGDIARFTGQFSTAHKEYDQALPVFRRLATINPQHQRDVSLCLSKIGELALEEGNIPAARVALEEHYAIAERIAAFDSSHSEHQRDLGGAHARLQALEIKSGNLAKALRHAEVAHGIMEKLLAIDPTNVSWVQDLAGSDCVFAMLLGQAGEQAGDMKRAASMFKNAFRILNQLAQEGKLDAKGKRLLAQLNDNHD